MDTIKLLIWDLDETFWKGTLSDGEITPVPENIELVKHLTDRGIVNSICSKNDYEKTKAKLEELGVWEYFVFPSIDWTPKGQRIKNIISDMNLRPVNCLFIDDNVNNLEEAKFAEDNINVTLPENLPELVKDPAFEGKDDSEHSRLKQYKILEEKAAARAQSGSNEEFLYQSEIHVELIEDCSDKLVRIYEMIHRNNQLNFTKDRISQEEVDRIFTDPEITSGVVHVTDKYGDHGIIGCYAIKDGKALQLVFSCRILGMGVEQWVYAELGYPEIEVVGEVAAELNKTDKPEWINLNQEQKNQDENVSDKTPYLIAYGGCSLRPVWAYIQPKLKKAKFAEIDPYPCCLNLAVALRESDEKKKELMERVGAINDIYTFDTEIYSPSTDYILITLQGTELMRKYVCQSTDTYFYSMPIGKDNTDPSIFDEYTATNVTAEDMEKELSYISEHICANTTLLLQTLPEVEFPHVGKDNDYYCRIEQNKVAEKIARKYKNVRLIDMRKYAKSPTDFYDPVPNHYNRNIGYYLSNDILEIMGLVNAEKRSEQQIDVQKNTIPENAFVQEFCIPDTDDKCKITTYIVNGVFTADVQLSHRDKYILQYIVICNRCEEFVSERTTDTCYNANVSGSGFWSVRVVLYSAENSMNICEFTSWEINYGKYNYIYYLDPKRDDYEESLIGLKETIGINIGCDSGVSDMIRQTSELSALGINPFDYFVQQGIEEISVLLDSAVGDLIMPYLQRSKLKIRYIFTIDNIYLLQSQTAVYNVRDINGPLPLSEKDVVLFAFSSGNFFKYRKIFEAKNVQIFSMPQVLSAMMTRYLFMERFKAKIPKIITVRTANLYRAATFDFSRLTPNEKLLENAEFTNEKTILHKIRNDYENLPPQLKAVPAEELLETMTAPSCFFDKKSGTYRFADVSGKYVNICDGVRETRGSANSSIGTIYIFGGPQAFGYGVKDSETIASYLQEIISLPYNVKNYANCWNYDYSYALNLMEKIDFKPNDIAVFILSNWRNDDATAYYFHWLHWDTIDQPIIKADAFPLFEKRDRPDYFLHRYGYTPACNMELAKLIRDAVYENIKLFDV